MLKFTEVKDFFIKEQKKRGRNVSEEVCHSSRRLSAERNMVFVTTYRGSDKIKFHLYSLALNGQCSSM